MKDWFYCPECGSEEAVTESRLERVCLNCNQIWCTNIDYSDVVQENLAALHYKLNGDSDD